MFAGRPDSCAQMDNAVENAQALLRRVRRGRGKGLDGTTVRAILKHVHYKDRGCCVRVQKTARVRLPDGRRVHATQLYWEYAFGLVARKIDAHMH